MIKHLVLFKLADEAEGNSKETNAIIIKEKLEALKNVIPVIRKMEVFINHAEASCANYDILLDSEFETLDDLKIYAQHPEHIAVGEFIVKVRTERAAIDYEF
ncbi:MAG: Dabb family protein [Proteiniphilum sp.]|nr:Dabb family protein [Proteiniphilum sp.]MDD4416486.1 Dabb family protein [Proteiniphilum sp.]